MCSCSTKGRASLVIEAEAEGEAEEEVAGAGVAEAEVAEAEVTGKCNGITTWPPLTLYIFAGAELKILYTLYYFTMRNLLSCYKNIILFIYIIFYIIFALYNILLRETYFHIIK